ncbi:dynamin family protein [Clostridium uliginosum]|uniref:Dynamin family protein n=1 Tax=Clostridium uliginosum TaxID=119641 RepID=A0A1I1HZ30_9CLOT|nr:dynamin family protein [Clostridium uliginosum]SFC29184.1 Dynamin family protein [Clostridium uliginosum]
MINDNRFIEIKDELHKITEELVDSAFEQFFIDRITSAKERLNDEKMNILVVGEFSRGKSTFINAILGKQILPSSVNPTTATINILEGSNLNNMNVYYRDRDSETIDLPNEKLKDFLDNFVTVKNEEVAQIERIKLNVSGNLEEWNCVLVDTPGVNDLDEAREEVTFKYLSQADVCIVLLDSQQPLSESERRFIKDKVLKNDINRLLFVINRIDDIDEMPDGNNYKRIREHIIGIIKETLPELEYPKVFGVSARETLKARHKNIDSEWEKSFKSFESEAIKFVSNNAVAGKMPQHIKRLKNICNDIQAYLKGELLKLECSNEELDFLFEKLATEANILTINLKDIMLIIEKEKIELQKEITSVSKTEFDKLKVKLVNQANTINSEEKLNMLKTDLSSGIRSITEKLSKIIYDHKEKLQEKFYNNLNKILKENNLETSLITTSNNQVNLEVKDIDELTYTSNNNSKKEKNEEADVRSLALGGVCGLVGAALFGGPVGVIIAVVGANYIDDVLKESKSGDEAKNHARNFMKNIIVQIDAIISKSQAKAGEIAAHEINEISCEYKEVLNNRLIMIEKSLGNKEKDLKNRKENLDNSKVEIKEKIENCNGIVLKLQEFEGELKNEFNI